MEQRSNAAGPLWTLTQKNNTLKERMMDEVESALHGFARSMHGANELGANAEVIRHRPYDVHVKTADGRLFVFNAKQKFTCLNVKFTRPEELD